MRIGALDRQAMERHARKKRRGTTRKGSAPQPLSDLPLFATEGTLARDAVFQSFENHRPTVVDALRAEAHRVYRETGLPVSANEIRHVLSQPRFEGIDHRILVTAFRGWKAVGHTTHNAPGNHARRICTQAGDLGRGDFRADHGGYSQSGVRFAYQGAGMILNRMPSASTQRINATHHTHLPVIPPR